MATEFSRRMHQALNYDSPGIEDLITALGGLRWPTPMPTPPSNNMPSPIGPTWLNPETFFGPKGVPQTQFQSDVSNFAKGLNPLHWWDVYSRNIGQPFQKWVTDYFNQPLASTQPQDPAAAEAAKAQQAAEYEAMIRRMTGGPTATGGYAGMEGLAGGPRELYSFSTPTIDFTQGLPMQPAPVRPDWGRIEAALGGMAPGPVPQMAPPAPVDTGPYREWMEKAAPVKETVPENERLFGILAALAGGLNAGISSGRGLGPAILSSGAAFMGERHRQSREDRELERRYADQSRQYAGQRATGELNISQIEAGNKNQAAEVDYRNRAAQYQADESFKQLKGRARLAFLDKEYELAQRTRDVEYANALQRYEAELKNRAQNQTQVSAAGGNLIVSEASPDGKSRVTKVLRYEDTAKLLQQMLLMERLSGGSLGGGGSGGTDKTWLKNIPKGAIGSFGPEAVLAARVITNRIGADILGLDQLEKEEMRALQQAGVTGADLMEQLQVRVFQRLIPLFAQNPEIFLQIGKLQGL